MQNELVKAFFRYASIPSQSDINAQTLPSSKGQLELASLLKDELLALGLEDIILDESAILTATLKANVPNEPKIGFCAHLDTVDVGLSPVIRPQILRFLGQDLVLNKEKNIILQAKSHPYLQKYLGEEIIFSDGTSVLGADNKAAIASIMCAIKEVQKYPHGEIKLAFVPDEEIGLRGAKSLPLCRFGVDFAYTIDCCELGELIFETFNAASALIHIKGVSAHPMNAKGVMVNPLLIASSLIQKLDSLQTPEHTHLKEGYIWAKTLEANAQDAWLRLDIRDHDKGLFDEKIAFVKDLVKKEQITNPKAIIELDIKHMYANIKDSINMDNPVCINRLKNAFSALNITPNIIAMRGGTDGSCLSARGIPTPNYFTGAHNFHSKFELLPISSFVKSFKLTLELMRAKDDLRQEK